MKILAFIIIGSLLGWVSAMISSPYKIQRPIRRRGDWIFATIGGMVGVLWPWLLGSQALTDISAAAFIGAISGLLLRYFRRGPITSSVKRL